MRVSVLLSMAMLIRLVSLAQEERAALEKDKRMPEFTLKNLMYYKRSELSNTDLLGKYTIIDFWTTGCPACISSFRKFDALRRKLGDSIQFILIGKDYLNKQTVNGAKITFQKYKEKWKFDLPVAFDAEKFDRFGVPFVPYCIWIDQDGIIREITTTTDVTESNVRSFISGKAMKISMQVDKEVAGPSMPFDYDRPLLINGNGGYDSAFLFRSLLSRWNKESPPYLQPFITSMNTSSKGVPYWAGVEKNRVQMNGVSIKQLIELAYGDTVNHSPGWLEGRDEESIHFNAQSSYGKYWMEPILQVADTLPFTIDWATGKNAYSYSLIIPERKASALLLRQAMQDDVEKYFGYDVSVEERSMPCWNLYATVSARTLLRSKSEKTIKINRPAEMLLSNVPIYQLIRSIYEYNTSQPPIIDQTGIGYRIDINLRVPLMDFDEVRNALAKNGLRLEKGAKTMKVIVVRDKVQ